MPGDRDDFSDFEPVGTGRSGALVRRSPGGLVHAKTARTPAAAAELAGERDRLVWLAGAGLVGVEVPRVLDWVGGERPTLVTSSLPGVPASRVGAGLRQAAYDALREAVGRLHALDVEGCPYDRTLAVTVPLARHAVRSGAVDTDDLDAERAGRSGADLLEELLAGVARATATEQGELVVCHGDATADNVLVDPSTATLVGIVDVGRLGRADRHLDLALLERAGLDLAARPWTADADPWRLDYYRLLDEFF